MVSIHENRSSGNSKWFHVLLVTGLFLCAIYGLDFQENSYADSPDALRVAAMHMDGNSQDVVDNEIGNTREDDRQEGYRYIEIASTETLLSRLRVGMSYAEAVEAGPPVFGLILGYMAHAYSTRSESEPRVTSEIIAIFASTNEVLSPPLPDSIEDLRVRSVVRVDRTTDPPTYIYILPEELAGSECTGFLDYLDW